MLPEFSRTDAPPKRDLRWLHYGGLVTSVILAAFLLILLFAVSKLDLAALGRVLLGVRPEAFGAVVLLLALNNFLSGEKWRLIAQRLQGADSDRMPRVLYFAFTSIGVAIGQVVPAQLSLVLSRSLGAHLHGGRALMRGATATVLDYFFDLLVAAGIAVCSLIVVLSGGGETAWAILVAASGALLFLLYASGARLVAGIARYLAARTGGRLRALCAGLALSPLLAPDIGRLLLAVSVVRFIVLVLTNAVTAGAVGLDLSLWQLGAALPFASLANALALTPGGLGLCEWAVSAALFALGISFEASARWAVLSRVLVGAAAVLLGVLGLAMAAAARWSRRGRRA